MEKKIYGIVTQGNIIRNNRIKKMWSQNELAQRIGVKQNSITFWENGYRKVPKKYIKPLCKELDIKEKDFFNPYYEEIEENLVTYIDPENLLDILLHKNKFKEKERFPNEFKTYLKIISENFLENGYELVVKEKKSE